MKMSNDRTVKRVLGCWLAITIISVVAVALSWLAVRLVLSMFCDAWGSQCNWEPMWPWIGYINRYQ